MGQAFSVYGKNAKFLAVITIIAFVPVFVFRMFIPQSYYEAVGNFIDTLSIYVLEHGQISAATFVDAPFGDAVTYFTIFFVIELAFFPLSVAAATYLVFKHNKEEMPTYGGMFTAALPILPKMIITSTIAFFIIQLLFGFTINLLGSFFGGFLLMIAIYISVGMVFYQHIVADVGRWGFNAISLSRFIVRGRWFRVFFRTIVIFVLYAIIAYMTEILGITLGLPANSVLHLPYFLLQHFALSYFAIVFALWYFDIKRFHALNFQEVEKEIMEKMRQHMDKFGNHKDEEDDEDK